MKYFIIALVVTLLSAWLRGRAGSAKAREMSGGWVFEPTGSVKTVFAVGAILGIALGSWGALGPQSDQSTLLAIGGGSLAVSIIGWPKAILITTAGLRQRTWYWSVRQLTWSEVSSIYKRQDNSIVVEGQGRKFVFSSSHAGRKLFLDELRQRLPRLLCDIPTS